MAKNKSIKIEKTPSSTNLKNQFFSALNSATLVGFVSSVLLFTILYFMYKDTWFRNSWDIFQFFIYIIGQYGGWIIVFTIVFFVIYILSYKIIPLIILVLIYYILYGNVWFHSNMTFIQFFSYLGVFGKWTLGGTVIFFIIYIIFLKRIPFIKLSKKPGLLFLSFTLFIQVLYWIETLNGEIYKLGQRPLNTQFHMFFTLFVCLVIYFVIFLILKRFIGPRNIIPSDKSIICNLILLSIIVFFAFSLTFEEIIKFNLPKNTTKEEAASYYNKFLDIIKNKDNTDIKPFNVLLISLDMLRADHLGCYGQELPLSPFMDSLASEGILFKNMRSNSSWTLPSHATMLTSLYPSQHGAYRFVIQNNILDIIVSSKIRLQEILKDLGYYTIGITGGGYMNSVFEHGKGFNKYIDDVDDRQVFFKADSFIINYKFEKPFLLFIHTYLVHNYDPSEKYRTMFCDTTLNVTKNSVLKNLLINRDNTINHFKTYPEKAKWAREHYAATVREADDLLRNLFKTMEKLELLENTIIIITSDHGEEFWEHKGSSHGLKYFEESIRIPLIVLLPKSFYLSKIVVTNNAFTLDLMPTILDLLNMPEFDFCEGISLLPAIKGENNINNRTTYLEASFHKIGAIQSNYKYIYNKLPPFDKRIFHPKNFNYSMYTICHYEKDELYNLVEDPFEKHNLVDEMPKLSEKLKDETINSFLYRFRNFGLDNIEGEEEIDQELIDKLRALGYIH